MPDQGDPDDANGSEDVPATGSADEPSTDDAGTGGFGDATSGDPDAGTGGGGAAGGGGGGGGGGRGGLGPDEQYCSSCGEPIKKEAEICPHCGVRNKSRGPSSGGSGSVQKDRTTAGILAIFLGWIGAHKFYLNDTGLGLLYLCFCWTFIPMIIGFIEGIIYLTKTDEEFQRQYVN